MATGPDRDGPASPAPTSPQSGPSSLLERMVGELGGWDAVHQRPEVLGTASGDLVAVGPPAPGAVIANRYELGDALLPPAQDLFRALDRTTRQQVLIHVLTSSAIDPSLTTRFAVSRAVSHANVARVHDLVLTPWGPAVVMEGLDGELLAARVAAARSHGGVDIEKFRRIASDLYAALAAIHDQGLAHGGIDTSSILLTDRKAVVLHLGFRGPMPSVVATDPAVQLRRAADDVRRAALVCWDTWSTQPPGPFIEPLSAPLRAHAVSDLPSRLSAGELRQIFDALSDDPSNRPRAAHMRFNESAGKTPLTPASQHVLDAGTPPGSQFVPNAQGFLVTFAQTVPELVGTILPLDAPAVTIGRSEEADLVVQERTVSYMHARFSWQRGSWLVEDLGSTNGTFTDNDYGRQTRTLLRHGHEIQLGEMRMMLVGFTDGSPRHAAARRWISRRDPLTSLLNEESLGRGMEQDARFSDWSDIPMVRATFRVDSRLARKDERPSILELLALRRVARRVVELTHNFLLATRPVVAGRAVETYPATPRRVDEVVVSIVAAGEGHVRTIIDLVMADATLLLPPSFSLSVQIDVRAPGSPAAPRAAPAATRPTTAARRPPTWRS